ALAGYDINFTIHYCYAIYLKRSGSIFLHPSTVWFIQRIKAGISRCIEFIFDGSEFSDRQVIQTGIEWSPVFPFISCAEDTPKLCPDINMVFEKQQGARITFHQ